MDESGFRHWLSLGGAAPKEISDTICRVRKLETDLGLSLDEKFADDRGSRLLMLFQNKGEGIHTVNNKSTLPIGKYSLATYKLASKKYFSYLEQKLIAQKKRGH